MYYQSITLIQLSCETGLQNEIRNERSFLAHASFFFYKYIFFIMDLSEVIFI